ncbi:hypothetical protein CDL12_19808 [Handroanthus impetiginosus]|uniref:DUF4378 domain-containing protein n=1 Tax=Handroanthus impetiginosus TaxID=429701 RepID=A0A2G9GQP6_9LAMI|nr:hypothetical protein CDL12_19808 [Handroanthus impetiginosus]
MAARLSHSFTDENPDLQKQIRCMTGIFQLFDRQHILIGGRHMVGHSPKRLPPGDSNFNGGTSEGDSNNAQLRSSSTEKYSQKNIQEKQRISTESSRASFSSSSRSSSFSSLDCNRATQLEPASFDRIIFPETTSRDTTMGLQSSSTQCTRQSLDLRDFVKDSMYREVQSLSVKAKTMGEAADSVMKNRDSPRPQSKIIDGSQAPSYRNDSRQLFRSSSFHSKEGSSFSVVRDAPRFSYDGREVNREPFDSQDVSKSILKLKELPRLSLGSRQGSMRSLDADSKSDIFMKSMQRDSVEFDAKVPSVQQSPGHQARPPSVVAKLMGLETLPDSVSSGDTNFGSGRGYQGDDFVNNSSSLARTDPSSIQLLNSSKNLRKEPISPRWKSPDSPRKAMSRFPFEPAPWKQIDGTRSSQKPASTTMRAPAKAPSAFRSVYSEIGKRLKDLEFTESGKDLRALKQILEAMQSKGFLETQKECHKDHEQKHLTSKHEPRSVNNRKPQIVQVLDLTKRKNGSSRQYESPIVIMKPVKLVEKSGIPAAAVISFDGLSDPHKHQDNEFVGKDLRSGRPTKDPSSKSSQRDNAANSVIMKNDRTLRSAHTSSRSQHMTKDGVGLGKSLGSVSPRMQQRKLELEKRSRPPTPPDSSKSRRQSNKQQAESNSPGGRRRLRHPNAQKSDSQASEVNVESRNLNYHEIENSVQSNESIIGGSRKAVSASPERSPRLSSCQSPSMKASDLMLSDLVEKKSTLALNNEEESAEFGCAPSEYSSPVSVLDNIVSKEDSPSPVNYVGKTLKVDESMDKERDSSAVQPSSEAILTSGINRKKLENIDNLVQKLRRLNSSHDESHTDYIASLCDNTDPDHRYISQILLASGLLLRELCSSLTNFQFHPSGHPINPELFLVLEQTKAGTEKTTQSMLKEKCHRKLIFDTVNEILARKLASGGKFSEPWLRPLKLAKRAKNSQNLLKELCSEIKELQARTSEFSSEEEDGRWKNILCLDMMHQNESWIDFDDEISGAVLDIERLIFKDLVNEIVMGESAGLKTKPGRRWLTK